MKDEIIYKKLYTGEESTLQFVLEYFLPCYSNNLIPVRKTEVAEIELGITWWLQKLIKIFILCVCL